MKELSSVPMAVGRTAEVFLWDEKQVLKLYRDWCPPDWVEEEARVARAIYEAGVPSPAAGETVEVNGRRGLVYERLEGISMLQDMNARPWMLLKHARSLADLHAKVHQQSIPGLLSYKDRLSYDIRNSRYLPGDLMDKIMAVLERLPNADRVCHGDFHPGNVLITKAGPVVIDWVTASAGSRWADVARTSLLLTIGPKGAGKQVSPVFRLVISLYHQIYLNRYRALIPDTANELERWTLVIAAARLNEEIVPERKALIKMVKEGIEE